MRRQDGLRARSGRLAAGTADGKARATLLEEVLGLATSAIDETWMSFCVFDDTGRCVANVDAAILPLVAGGTHLLVGGIRFVAVAPHWRGRGLFRSLMVETLAWCDARAAEPVLLYTAEPALYGRFGFQQVAQYAFVGPAPSRRRRPTPAMEIRTPAKALVEAILARRAPVSLQAALMVGADLFMTNTAQDADLEIAFAPSLDTVLISETEHDTLVVVDIVAPLIPPLATLLGAFERSPRCIKTLFPPDRLGWHGEPVCEATGLMARGPLPPAFAQPFMFPPTTEF